MNKKSRIFAVLLLLVVLLAACGSPPAPSAAASAASSSAPSAVSAPPVQAEYFQPDGLDLGAAPDFLDAEQQQLYLRAKAAYTQFSVQCGFGASMDEAAPTHTQEGLTYVKLDGYYTTWASFEADMLSIFTEDFLAYMNAKPLYISVDGDLYGLVGAGRGPIPSYVGPDTFELTYSGDNSIDFLVQGNYGEDASETSTGIPISLIKEEDGIWRFSAFSITY